MTDEESSSKYFRRILDNTIEGCLIIGFDWRYRYVNDAVLRYAGKTRDELLGRTLMEVYPGIDVTPLFQTLARCMATREPTRLLNEFDLCDGGTGWFDLAVQPIDDGVFVMSRDVTPQMQAEAVIRTHLRQLDTLRAMDRQRASLDLERAYDTTIEGWSRALDLRDHDTEGHAVRVTNATLRLARAAGLNDAELVHVRRGALLHDIGKMGVPDAILHKPASLTEDEWVVMRAHPRIAYELLEPIAYLRPALDIPYCHHERWDGSGYPRGLAGHHIPLTARLFAVVDVWDALRSDRPYRSRWPEAAVLDHIRGGAGSHFDPEAVDLFMEMVAGFEELSVS